MVDAAIKDAFLCHNRADKQWVRELGERIEQEEWGGRKLSVFLDEWDIQPGENILLKIDEALKRCRFVVVVLSPEMLRSDWCSLELTATLAQDPMNRQGRLLPLLRRDADLKTGERIEIPPILRPFNHLDFRDDKDFARSFAKLVARIRGEAPPRRAGTSRLSVTAGVPLPAPLAAYADSRQAADPVPETLISNLLPVLNLPGVVWSAPTSLKSKADLPQGNDLPPFILREERVYTFADLSAKDTPFKAWLSRPEWKRHAVKDFRAAQDRWRWVTELLNLALKDHLFKRRIVFDRDSKRFFFRAPEGGRSVRLRWGSGTKKTVVKGPDPEKGGYWVHQGARFNFETLGDRVYLAIEPCWVFTRDGRKSISKQDIGPMAMQWGGKERNAAIFRHVLMWSDVLTGGRRTGQIDVGGKPVVIGRLPVTVGMSAGIADDQVAIKALLKFTQAEQEMEVSEEIVFGFLEENDGETDEEEEADDDDAA